MIHWNRFKVWYERCKAAKNQTSYRPISKGLQQLEDKVLLAGPEDIDEMFARKDRRDTAIWGPEYLEDPNTFVWQPETFMYHDVTTGAEVWKMSSTPLLRTYYSNDIGVSPWNADGSKMAFTAWNRLSQAYNWNGYDGHEFIEMTIDTTGDTLRPTVGGATHTATAYMHWSPQEPGAYYDVGNRYLGTGATSDTLYRNTVAADGTIVREAILTLPAAAASGTINKMISADGRKLIIEEDGRYFPITILADGSAQLDVPGGYSMDRGFERIGNMDAGPVVNYHDQYMSGLGDWYYAMPSGSSVWLRVKTLGSGPDGGALYTGDQLLPADQPPYDFGEVWPENYGGPFFPQPISSDYDPDLTAYWSHFVPDRWGRYALFSNGSDGLPIDRGSYYETVGPGVWDILDHEWVVPSHGGGAQHHDWSGFTDWTVSSSGSNPNGYPSQKIVAQKYDDPYSQIVVNSAYTRYDGGTNYASLIRPGQSPDGTKVSWHSEFLNGADATDIFWSVVYNPYPATDLEAASATGDGVELGFLPPKYTERRWIDPATGKIDEVNGEVLYAREIKEYQVWRSTSPTSGWDIAGTVAADYDNDSVTNTLKPLANGDWVSGTNKITFDDNPGDGVWYYAVTSTEHSGLESDELSEVIRVTISGGEVTSSQIVQAQGQKGFYNTAPAAPFDFTASQTSTAGHYELSWSEPGEAKIRYYNVYYSTTGDSFMTDVEAQDYQQFRIASLTAGTDGYLDWLADPNADGFYGITSVDRYGNESDVTYVGGGGGNYRPTAVDDTSVTNEEAAILIDILANDTDSDGTIVPATVTIVDGPENGSVERDPGGSGTVTYTPNDDYFGEDTFQYTVQDDGGATSNSATVTVTVNNLNDLPVAVEDGYSIGQGETLTTGTSPGPSEAVTFVAENSDWRYLDDGSNQGTAWRESAFDVSGWSEGAAQLGYGDGDETTVVGYGGDAGNKFVTTYFQHEFQVDNAAGVSALTVDVVRDDGVAVYLNGVEILRDNLAPAAGYNDFANGYGDDAQFFQFTASPNLLVDGRNVLAVEIHQADAGSSDISFDLRLTGEAASGPELPGVLANDTDADRDTLTASLASAPSHGIVALNTDGSFTYTPNAGFDRTDSFTYIANDGQADSQEATVTISVGSGGNVAPEAVNDSYNATENTALVVNQAQGVLDNDRDDDGDPLTAVLASAPSHGSVALNINGSFTYTPNAGFTRTDSFTYRANDGQADSNVATVTISVSSAANSSPVAVNDPYNATENTALVVNQAQGVLANDTDADQDTLTASLASAPSRGIVTLNTNGSFTYTPNADFTGTDSFTYRASDGQGSSDVATVTLDVVAAGPVNNPPTATGDAYDAYEGMPLSVSAVNGVLGNDADADQDTLSASLVADASNGTVILNTNGSFTYTPNAGFNGSDSFTYRANDGQDNSSPATVTLDVTPLTALGVVDFREIAGLNLTDGNRWYGVQASRQGYFTIAALFTGSTDNLQVTLYDANHGELASSSPAAGGERTDWQASAGATYYFSVSGSIADVDLRLANLVQLQGDAVTVYGTAAVDQFEFTASSPYLVAVNGVEYQFDPATVASVAFDGAAGDDTAVLTGSIADDTAIVYPDRGLMRGTGYEVNVAGTTSVAVHGGGGTTDVAHLYDSSGDDAFTSSPNTGTLSGSGFSNSAAGFYYVHGYGKAGGLDTATFYDSPGDDKFIGRPTYSKMEGPGFYNRGKAFDQVYAYSSTGDDEAHLRGSRNSEVFYAYADGTMAASHLPGALSAAAVPLATSTLGEMIGTDFYYNARGFEYLHGYALQGGTDSAQMYDSSANDRFVTNPTMKFGKLFDEGRTYQTRAKFFDFVHAYATGGGNDTAVLFGSGGDDIFVGRSDYSRMIGPTFNYRAKLFENVYGNAGAGGNDQAFLYDSEGDDLLETSGRSAKMSYGPTWVEAVRFAWVQANSNSGGNDTKNEDSTDFVLQAQGPWADV